MFTIYDKQNDTDFCTGFRTEQAAYDRLHEIAHQVRRRMPNAIISGMYIVVEEEEDQEDQEDLADN